MQQIALAVNRLAGRNMQLQQEQGHGHREDAIAQRGQPFNALPGDSVVACGHSLDSLFAWRGDSRLPCLSGSEVLPTKRRCEARLSVFGLPPEKKKGAQRAAPFLLMGCGGVTTVSIPAKPSAAGKSGGAPLPAP